MNFSYSYVSRPDSMEGIIAAILVYAFCAMVSGGIGIAQYVFRSLGVYSIAKRRGLRNPWFAWVPVVNQYLLGSLSDQYQYVVKGKNKSKRKWLLGLNIVLYSLYTVMVIMAINVGIQLTGKAMAGYNDLKMARLAMQSVSAMLIVVIPMLVVSLAAAVIRYVALHQVYVSLDPKNSTLYTALSILFRVTEPFFLFFNRNKDEGMPPRRNAEPVVEATTVEEEPWSDD